jgi:hypothetical protein
VPSVLPLMIYRYHPYLKSPVSYMQMSCVSIADIILNATNLH